MLLPAFNELGDLPIGVYWATLAEVIAHFGHGTAQSIAITTPRGGGTCLAFHTERPIRRHVKVQARRSPYDGDEVYWSTRRGHYPGVSKRVSTLLKRQAGKCRHCGYYFKMGDVLEVDHIIPRVAGGRDVYTNWQLLHRYCHVAKTVHERRQYA
ncbi:MAG TPA: HNH endonuclease [Candidatus Tectomicrobia bacterium]|nr:HNH endonuclease [Candidatus Tectomicrobia bacterium]